MARRSASSTRDRSRPTARGRSTPARLSLQSRILSRVLVISIAPMLLIGMIALVSLLGLSRSAEQSVDASRQELTQDVAGRAVRTDATGVAREVERLLAERFADVIDLSVSPLLVSAAEEAATDTGDALVATPTAELEQQYDGPRRLDDGSDAERHLRAIAKRQSVFRQLLFTERNGFTVGSSSKPEQLGNRSTPWWSTAWDDGFYIGPVEQVGEQAYGLTVAAPIGEQGGDERAGVLRAIINLNVLQQTADRIAQDAGSDVTLLTDDGLLLAETGSEHSASRMLDPDIELDPERAETVERALNSSEPGFLLNDTAVAGFAPVSSVDGRLRRLLQRFDGLDQRPISWIAVVERSNDAAFAPLAGLSDVSDGLRETARTFGIIVIVALLASLIAAFLVSTRLAQRIVGPLRSLGATARNIADNQLPVLVHRAQTPGGDRDADLPMIPAVELHTDDEIEDVADAFNIVSSTAADLAADQARSRRDVARMFVSLGRRNQNLLSRQLEFIDRLERDTSDPDLLDDLFRLDHLATRMRRNAESLLVLAGEQPARRWSEPVSLTAVVRGAISEVEDYRRVTLDGVHEALLAGAAVGDVTHLLAELIENATQFSPPDTPVEIVGRRVVDGYALAVVDDGVGMSEEQLEDANRRIDASPMVDRVPSSFLGLFVVGRLAARHGIRVRLVESTTEGVTAKVLLPPALIDPPVPTGVAGDRRPAVEADVSRDEGPVDAAHSAAEPDRERVSASAVRDRNPAFDQTSPPIPGRRGRTWSSHARTSSFTGAPFDQIEVRGLTRDEIDIREPESAPDRAPVDEPDDRSAAGDDPDDQFPAVDEHGRDGGGTAAPVDEAVDLWEPSAPRDAGPGATEDAGDAWSAGGFDDLPYTGGVRYPPVDDTAADDMEPAEDATVADMATGSTVANDPATDAAVAEDAAAVEAVAEGAAADPPVPEDGGLADTVDAGPAATVDDAPADVVADAASDASYGAQVLDDRRTPDPPEPPRDVDAGAWWARGLGEDDDADAVQDEIWVPDDAPATATDDITALADNRVGDPSVHVAPQVDDDRRDDWMDAEEERSTEESDAASVLEVRRRPSRRDGGDGTPANGRPSGGRALLRAERAPLVDDGAPASARPPAHAPAPATTSAEVADEDGVALTAAEREARAARDRLSRFQRAVQQGRSQTRSRRNGGDEQDA